MRLSAAPLCCCSNEIAGDSEVLHPCVGSSRRLVVPDRDLQHQVLLEAVQNLTPDVVICDELRDGKVGRVISESAVSQQ